MAAAGGGVWKTTDGGTTWASVTDLKKTLSMGAIAMGTSVQATIYAGTGEANKPVWSLQIGSVNGTFYVGADDGVYATTNTGSTWSRFGTGLPHAQVFQIELNSSLHILGAGTHGRSMWEITAQ